jgi:hypothetical protein
VSLVGIGCRSVSRVKVALSRARRSPRGWGLNPAGAVKPNRIAARVAAVRIIRSGWTNVLDRSSVCDAARHGEDTSTSTRRATTGNQSCLSGTINSGLAVLVYPDEGPQLNHFEDLRTASGTLSGGLLQIRVISRMGRCPSWRG